ncbi:MAG: PAS domain-containing sensor histidine kinase [Elusimicrobia bacterium]|nr:PAS domain-containing sensor histidine kinase [Elusimicrobiota bacterium]
MNEQSASATPRVMELCRGFLKSLGQTVKLVSLYSMGHPVPASSQQESWQLLHELFSESGWPEISFSLVAGRWLVNGQLAADSAQAYELLALAFRAHALHSVTFRPECRLYELSALCELASTPANRAYQTNADDFLKERGVRHVSANVEEFVKARRVTLPASPLMRSPRATAPAPRAVPEPGAPPPQASEPARAEPVKTMLGFGSFIKNLVDKAVADPQERAQIYAEALKHVEQALARRGSEASHKLLLEKQHVVNERVRAESVMTTVAQGKVIVDQEGRVLMMDPAAEEIVGRSFSAVAGKKILEELDSLEHGDKFVVLAKELVVPENRPVSEEMLHAGASEVMDAFRQSVAVVHDEQGRVVGTYAVLPHAAKFRETQKMQQEFMDNITHDLKAPLTSICSALEVLNDTLRPKLRGEEADFLDICVRNSGTLRQMIDELLDFSKASSGRMTVRPEKTPLEPLLRECAQVLLPWARSKKIALEVAPDPESKALPPVLADRRRVLQVLNNLVSNAIKFTPEGGSVALSAAPGGDERPGTVVVKIRDTGCGISPEDRKRLFERFAQGQAERREGVGLGLAIARELILQHRGELWVDSEIGRGSTFSFTLPQGAS